MSEQALSIIDQSLEYSLWAFLIVFVIVLFFISRQLKARKRGLLDYFREEIESSFEEEIKGTPKSPDPYIHLSDRLRMAFHALLISVSLALVCFIVVGFTPLPFLSNFATVQNWQGTPLRVTSLNYERFHEGFSLEGEVWNQSQEPMMNLQAVIRIWKSESELLDQLQVPVDPDPLPPLSAGTFRARYTKNSPFLYGYQVSFQTLDGSEVPHVKGFDVR